MLPSEARSRFIQLFRVPDAALPYLDAMVDETEIRLVLAAGEGSLTAESAASALGIPVEEAAAALERAFRRGVLDRKGEAGRASYTATDFYTRMDYCATFEDGWAEIPAEGRMAMDEWMLSVYVERVRENVGRLMAGQPAEGSPGNDSVLLAEECDAVIDAARTIVVVPCNCRKIGTRCSKPTETCIQFDTTAEKKLERGYGRRLTAREAKDLIRFADAKGLMHTTDLNYGEEGPAPICNCCSDDCYVFRAAATLESKGAWPRSRYVASFNREACLSCGACTMRCPFGAFHYDGSTTEQAGLQVRSISLDSARCWGCGLCANICPAGAITMSPLAER